MSALGPLDKLLLNRMRLAAAAGQLDDELFARINSSLGQPCPDFFHDAPPSA